MFIAPARRPFGPAHDLRGSAPGLGSEGAWGYDTKMGQNPSDTAWEILHHRKSEKCDMTRGMGTYSLRERYLHSTVHVELPPPVRRERHSSQQPTEHDEGRQTEENGVDGDTPGLV
jgi:hypothetical protein